MDVGEAVGVGVCVRLRVGMGISLLGLTWNRPTVTIDFFSENKETRIFFNYSMDSEHVITARQSKTRFLHFLIAM